MYTKAILATAAALFFAGQTVAGQGSTLDSRDGIVKRTAANTCKFSSSVPGTRQHLLIKLCLIDDACNCPNNCEHKLGTPCAWWSGGQNNNGDVLTGSKSYWHLESE